MDDYAEKTDTIAEAKERLENYREAVRVFSLEGHEEMTGATGLLFSVVAEAERLRAENADLRFAADAARRNGNGGAR